MPPRLPISPSICRGVRSRAPLSTTAASQALRNDASSKLLDIDSDSSRRGGYKSTSATQLASDLFDTMPRTAPRGPKRDTVSHLKDAIRQEDLVKKMPRRWRAGEVYAPHDLSANEMEKFRSPKPLKTDVIDLLGLKPLDMYRNFSVISEYMTPHGRIKSGAETGLKPVNQRKMAKAIRRSIGLGLHPSVHRHPEIMLRHSEKMNTKH